jgi:hypothetical protein
MSNVVLWGVTSACDHSHAISSGRGNDDRKLIDLPDDDPERVRRAGCRVDIDRNLEEAATQARHR